MTEETPPEIEPQKDESTQRFVLPEGELYELLRLKILREVESEVLTWTARRFWMSALIVLVAGAFGVSTLVRATVRELMDDDRKEYTEMVIELRQKLGPFRDLTIDDVEQFAEVSSELGAVLPQMRALRADLDSAQETVAAIEELSSSYPSRTEIDQAMATFELAKTQSDSLVATIDRIVAHAEGFERELDKQKALNKESERLIKEMKNVTGR